MNKKIPWTLISGIFVLASFISLPACSDDKQGSPETKGKSDHIVHKEQIPVISKVSAAEVLLKDVPETSYKKLSSPQPTRTGSKIEILEVFWYGCSHCYYFEPTIGKWLEEKADYIEFVRMPGVLGKNWLPHARAFYAAEKLGVLDKIHQPLFDAIHKEKRKIMDKKELKRFFVGQGVNGDDFDQAFHSKEVENSVRYAFTMGQHYELTGVPAVIINGKYGTSASMAGSYNKIIDVVNTLAAKEHARMKK